MCANIHSSTRAPRGFVQTFQLASAPAEKFERLDRFIYVLLLDTTYALIADALT